MLPCSIDEIRSHLEDEGDLTFEALSLLRQAEEERREKLENCRKLRQALIRGVEGGYEVGDWISSSSSQDFEVESSHLSTSSASSSFEGEMMMTSKPSSSKPRVSFAQVIIERHVADSRKSPPRWISVNPEPKIVTPRTFQPSREIAHKPPIAKQKGAYNNNRGAKNAIDVRNVQRSSSTYRARKPANKKLLESDDRTIDLNSTGISKQDRKILQCLAMKSEAEVRARERSEKARIRWREEGQQLEAEKARREREWRRTLDEKRMREYEENDKRLEDAKKVFEESQQKLIHLIRLKEERKRKASSVERNRNEWRNAEEARRLAVEVAIEDLLVKDTQYRRRLIEDLRTKLTSAEMRRQSRIDKYKEEKAAEAEKHLAQVMLIQRERREEIKKMRRNSRNNEEKMMKMRQESANNKKEKILRVK